MQAVLSNREPSILNARKFTMYLAIAGMLMLFAALTSAYLVRRSVGNWLEFQLPGIFYVSTAVIIASSIALHLAYKNFKAGNPSVYRSLLGASLFLGTAFIVLQYLGWMELNEAGVFLQTNPSASFLFVITGMHAAHIIGGLGALAVTMLNSLRLKFAVTPRRKNSLEMMLIFWHFVDFLWIYLMIFFVFQ